MCMNRALKFLLVAAFLNSLSFIIVTPIWQYPDEQAHFAQVQDLAEIGRVPTNGYDTSEEIAILEKAVGTERDQNGNNKYTYHPEYKTEYNNSKYGLLEKEISNLPLTARTTLVKNESTLNPPLYYFLSSLVYKSVHQGDIFTRVYLVRIFSVLIFILTIIVSYKIGKIVFDESQPFSLALAAMIAFTPMLVHATSGVLPDTLNIFLFTFFLYVCLRIIYEGFSLTKFFLLVLTITLGAMTRQNFLITLFILPVPIAYEFLFRKDLRLKIMKVAIASAAGLYLLSYKIPGMHFIHTFDYPESSFKNPSNPLASLTFTEHLLWTIKISVSQTWPWFWGIYKWLSLALPPEVYQIINRLIPVSIIGLFIKIYSVVRKKDIKNGKILMFLCLSILIYFLFLTVFDYLFRKNNGYTFGIQGRYYFPVIVPAFALFLSGFLEIFNLFKKYSNLFLFMLVFLFLTFNLFTLFYIANSYYNTQTLETFVNHSSQYKPYFLKSNSIVIILTTSVFAQIFLLIQFFKTTIHYKSPK